MLYVRWRTFSHSGDSVTSEVTGKMASRPPCSSTAWWTSAAVWTVLLILGLRVFQSDTNGNHFISSFISFILCISQLKVIDKLIQGCVFL
jgi:hypothetical protein